MQVASSSNDIVETHPNAQLQGEARPLHPPMTQPVATYRERRFDGRRTFELFADRVRIAGSTQFSSEFDFAVQLSGLNPEPMRIRFRNKAFWAGTWMLLGSIIGCTVLLSAMQASYASAAFVLVAVVGASGFALMLATARKVEFVGFQNSAGLRVLDIARSGPDAGQLDAFIELVVTHIRRAAQAETV